MFATSRRHREPGQTLVLFALMLTGILLATSLIIDVGNDWAQQRATQNATDAAAEAGTVIIAQYLAGSTVPPPGGTCPLQPQPANTWDLAVCQATYGSAQTAGITLSGAVYTDYQGNPIIDGSGNPVAVGQGFPTGAQGIRAYGSRTFGTSFARVAGIDSMTVTSQATALTGAVSSYCPPGTSCGVLPLTIPYVVSYCDGSGKLTVGDSNWPLLGANEVASGANEQTVPICKNKNGDIGGGSAGSVGFIDLTTLTPASNVHLVPGACTGGNGAQDITNQIQNNCFSDLSFPAWVKTVPGGAGKGGPNGPQGTMNTLLHGKVVLLPMFDFSCSAQPTGPNKSDCSTYPQSSGSGNNTWYHITTFTNFLFDQADLSGNAKKTCGGPGNGSDGCLKGWFVKALTTPGQLQMGPVTPGTNQPLGVELIR